MPTYSVYVSNIEWDIDEESNLPEEYELEVEIDEDWEEEECEDAICESLSNTFSFCIRGYQIDTYKKHS